MVDNLISISLIARNDLKKIRQLMESTSDELSLFGLSFIGKLKSCLFISVKNGRLSYLRKSKKEKMISIDETKEFHFLPVESPYREIADIMGVLGKTVNNHLAYVHNFKSKKTGG